MAYPSIQGAFVKCSRLLRSLMPSAIIGEGVILLGAISSSIHEDDTVISLIPHARPRPALLIQHGLVRFLRHVRRAIRDPPITEDQAGALAHLRQSSYVILEVDLEFDDIRLELDEIPRVVLGEVTQPTSHADYGRHLRDKEHLETALGEVLLNGLKGSALAGTRTTSQRDAVDRIFLVSDELGTDAFQAERRGSLQEHLGHGGDFGVDGGGDPAEFFVLVVQVFQEGQPGDAQNSQGELIFMLRDFVSHVSHLMLVRFINSNLIKGGIKPDCGLASAKVLTNRWGIDSEERERALRRRGEEKSC